MAINFPVSELNKMKHIEEFVKPEKTMVEYKPHFWSDKRYVVAILKKQQGKKGKGSKEFYQPIYQSTSLDHSLLAYNNTHILDMMSMKRQKTLLKMKSDKGENLKKKLLLDSDFEDQNLELIEEKLLDEDMKKIIVTKIKDLKVNIIQIVDNDELCLE